MFPPFGGETRFCIKPVVSLRSTTGYSLTTLRVVAAFEWSIQPKPCRPGGGSDGLKEARVSPFIV